jgi:hypothetical protein
MSLTEDDPFASRPGGEPEASEDAPPRIELPSSADQMKRTLQAHLADTQRQKINAGKLGERWVAHEQELRNCIREIEEGLTNDTVDPELKRKLSDLEKEYMDVGRETNRAMLTSKITNTGRPDISPFGGSNVRTVPLSGYESSLAALLRVRRDSRSRIPKVVDEQC